MLAKTSDRTCPYTGKTLTDPKSNRDWSEVAEDMPKGPRNGRHWYVVHCAGAPTDDLIYCAEVEGWGVFMPKCMELKAIPKRQLPPSRRNSVFPVRRPVGVHMFPRYPFLNFDFQDGRRYEMFKLFGVQGVICEPSMPTLQPAFIPDAVIQALKEGSAEDGALPLGTTVRSLAYKIGELVRISYGPFSGLNASVEEIPNTPLERLDEQSRLRLLVSLFGRQTPIELPISDIERL